MSLRIQWVQARTNSFSIARHGCRNFCSARAPIQNMEPATSSAAIDRQLVYPLANLVASGQVK